MEDKIVYIELLLECADLLREIDSEVKGRLDIEKTRGDLKVLRSVIKRKDRKERRVSLPELFKKYPSL